MAEAPFLRATRESYDAIAVHRGDRLGSADLSSRPLDRALLRCWSSRWVTMPANTG